MNSKYTILLVDDDVALLDRWEAIVQHHTRVIKKAHSGHEAMKMITSEQINLVITDIDMPVESGPQMNGFELIKHIKESSVCEHINIIFTVDNHETIDDVVHGLEDGAIDFLMEPLHDKLTKAKIAIYQRLFNYNKALISEQQKSENLLKNILPIFTINELKNNGKSAARQYQNVSVLFTDFVNFTKLSKQIEATELVQKLNSYFSKFDDIVSECYLEKIKTIGDAYMAAGGIPIRNKFNAVNACLAALKLMKYVNSRLDFDSDAWQIRIGINTGPLVAGIVGKTKYQYDIWGDTVNIASRIEGKSEAGRINISRSTYESVKEYYNCTYRGNIAVKNGGMVEMYFLDGIKEKYCVIGDDCVANSTFIKVIKSN